MNNRKELIEYRTPNTKYYLKKDGTIEVEIYDEKIHYLKNNKFEEIDNNLIEKETCFVNAHNDFKVEFNKHSKNLINISSKNNKLGISLKNTKNLNNLTPNKDFNEMKFPNIYENIDIKYELISNKLKVSINIYNKN